MGGLATCLRNSGNNGCILFDLPYSQSFHYSNQEGTHMPKKATKALKASAKRQSGAWAAANAIADGGDPKTVADHLGIDPGTPGLKSMVTDLRKQAKSLQGNGTRGNGSFQIRQAIFAWMRENGLTKKTKSTYVRVADRKLAKKDRINKEVRALIKESSFAAADQTLPIKSSDMEMLSVIASRRGVTTHEVITSIVSSFTKRQDVQRAVALARQADKATASTQSAFERISL